MTQKKLHTLILSLCGIGAIWVILSSFFHTPGVCIIKNVTGVPCPSCGATRSFLALLQGNFSEAMYLNPIGIFLFLILFIIPPAILYDVVFKKEYFFSFYKKVENQLKKKQIAIPLIALVLINWIWNIYKQI